MLRVKKKETFTALYEDDGLLFFDKDSDNAHILL